MNEEGGSVRPAQKRVKEARKRAYRRGYPYVDGPATRNEKRWESGACIICPVCGQVRPPA